jgi:GT2 family glycosyltransferase
MQPLKLVSIGVPIYKRLEYLPSILKMVDAQDYPAVELIISDNGQNGTKVRNIVETEYRRPYKFRQNSSTVDVMQHHNQLIREASGEYFHLLSDDDEISPNFVSDLVQQLELHPEATLAYARLEIINKAGVTIERSNKNVPMILSGPDFIRSTWEKYEFNYHNLEGFLARTKCWQKSGGYPEFTRGFHTDNAAVVRLCLDNHVALSSRCLYRHRADVTGESRSASTKELAAASREFLLWLDHDRTMQRFAAEHGAQWQAVKRVLVRMIWETYLWRWKDSYQNRQSNTKWIREAFRMPPMLDYYKNVGPVLFASVKTKVKRALEERWRRDIGIS